MTGRELIRRLMEEHVDLDAPVVLRTPDTLPEDFRHHGDHVDWNMHGVYVDNETYEVPVIALTDYGDDDD